MYQDKSNRAKLIITDQEQEKDKNKSNKSRKEG
jgi:nitrogen fixation-related uncharacterized protein